MASIKDNNFYNKPNVLYRIGKKKIALLDVITSPEEYSRMCRRVSNIMKRAGDYKDAPEISEEYRVKAADTMEIAKKEEYESAIRILKNAKSIPDYDRGLHMLQELKTYEDARGQFEYYRKIKRDLIRKNNLVIAVRTILILAAIVAGWIACMNWLEKAQALKEEQKLLSEKVMETETEAETEAETEVMDMDQLLQTAKIGKDTVTFGAYDWLVLDKGEDWALLIVKESEHFKELSYVPYNDTLTKCDWEHCTLREWLNSEFLNTYFSEEEKERIQLTEVVNKPNSSYQTSSGDDTRDYVYLLSEEEAVQYWDILKKLKCNWILRTAGNEEEAVAFVSSDHTIRLYGCAVTDAYYVRPVIKVGIDTEKYE